MKKYLKYLMNCSGEYDNENHIDNVFNRTSKYLPFFHPANLLDVGRDNDYLTINRIDMRTTDENCIFNYSL